MSCEITQGFYQRIDIGRLGVDETRSARGSGDTHTFEERQRRKISAANGNAALIKIVDDIWDGEILKYKRKN